MVLHSLRCPRVPGPRGLKSGICNLQLRQFKTHCSLLRIVGMEGCVNIFVLINWHSCHFLEETLGLELLVETKIDLPRRFVCWSFSAESSKQKYQMSMQLFQKVFIHTRVGQIFTICLDLIAPQEIASLLPLEYIPVPTQKIRKFWCAYA